jgi:hypothetical protein
MGFSPLGVSSCPLWFKGFVFDSALPLSYSVPSVVASFSWSLASKFAPIRVHSRLNGLFSSWCSFVSFVVKGFCFWGSVAVFVGERAVEKAAPWKSPTPGLSHSAWKSRNRGGISHFSHRPDYGGLTRPIFPASENS